MNFKHRFSLLIIVSIFVWGLSSCNDDNVTPYAEAGDVSLKQSINGQESFDLTDPKTELIFSTLITTDDKEINWSETHFEQSFSNTFTLSEENVIITDKDDSIITSADISVVDNAVKIAFNKIDDKHNSLKSSTLKIDIKSNINPDISDDELSELNNNGFESQSTFNLGANGQKTISNKVSLTSKIDPDAIYNIKGDPDNNKYKYKLNVVYFVPSDIEINADYKKRMSTILLKHQLFVRKWMKHWGYEEKSFGLPLLDNGMVDIVLMKAKGTKKDYPYSGGGAKMIPEIQEYYKEKGLTFFSEHTLVITATNETTDETPFYGYGKWCFALDYPGLAYEAMTIDPITGENMNSLTDASHKATVWIGGMLHELQHGLNMPHVGSTYSQKNDPTLGTTLMGPGNRTYGEKPTFLHPASAAIFSNCQASSFIEKDFYKATTSTLNILKPVINGNKCTVKGDFTASEKVTDVIVRFFNADEAFLGGSSGYSSVAFTTKPSGKSFEITIPAEELKINQFNYKIGVTILMDNGTAKSASLSDTYKLIGKEGNFTLETSSIDKTGWNVTVSHQIPKDDAISNAPNSLVDGNMSTCLALVKPGRSYGGITVPATDKAFAIIDMTKEQEFDTVVLIFRHDNTQAMLRASEVSFYGSNDGTNFTPIKENNALDVTKQSANVKLDSKAKYRYLKMTYDRWNPDQGGTMQFAELGLENN